MKYFLDTEFIEGMTLRNEGLLRFTHPKRLRRERHFIDLISISIVAEDGREYYAISNEFNPKDANEWVKDNVISKLEYRESWEPYGQWDKIYEGWEAVKKIGKPNRQIAKEIVDFINPAWLGQPVESNKDGKIELSAETVEFINLHNAKPFDFEGIADYYFAQPEFYGYYADYDWVLFASLWGTMMDLPKGFPMYCRDLKQMFDDKCMEHVVKENYSFNFEDAMRGLEGMPSYPTQVDEHNALADAHWNRALYNFIQSV